MFKRIGSAGIVAAGITVSLGTIASPAAWAYCDEALNLCGLSDTEGMDFGSSPLFAPPYDSEIPELVEIDTVDGVYNPELATYDYDMANGFEFY